MDLYIDLDLHILDCTAKRKIHVVNRTGLYFRVLYHDDMSLNCENPCWEALLFTFQRTSLAVAMGEKECGNSYWLFWKYTVFLCSMAVQVCTELKEVYMP